MIYKIGMKLHEIEGGVCDIETSYAPYLIMHYMNDPLQCYKAYNSLSFKLVEIELHRRKDL